MQAYRFMLRPLSAWATPWHADTLFGCLCWAWRDIAGEDKLLGWLKAFRDGTPPFVISDAFPHDILPFPLAARPKQEDPDAKLKAAWTSVSETRAFLQGTSRDLVVKKNPLVSFALPHASIGRTTNRADEGELFEIEQEYWEAGGTPPLLDLYVRAEDSAIEAVAEALALAGVRGFGRRGSTGLGAFEAGEPEPCPWLDDSTNAGSFLSLSHFIPSPDDPTRGLWRTHVSYPKFHGSRVRLFAKGSLVFLAPGSMLAISGECRGWYGSMIKMPVDGMPDALHYGLAFAAPALWRPD